MVKRHKRMLARSVFTAFRADILARILRNNKKLSFEKKFKGAYKFLHKLVTRLKLNIIHTGLENIPKDIKGCLFIGNHQGMGDGPILLHILKDFPTSYVVNDARSHGFLIGPVCDLLKVKRIKFDDLESQVEVYKQMAKEIVEEDMRFIVFPEAYYDKNRNVMHKFNTPCFQPAIKTKCPIIPFCLYDAWKAYEDESTGMVNVYCHILKPIFYEEYKGMNKRDLAKLVQSRIQEKLDEIEASK